MKRVLYIGGAYLAIGAVVTIFYPLAPGTGFISQVLKWPVNALGGVPGL